MILILMALRTKNTSERCCFFADQSLAQTKDGKMVHSLKAEYTMTHRRMDAKEQRIFSPDKISWPAKLVDGIFEVWWHLRKFLWVKKNRSHFKMLVMIIFPKTNIISRSAYRPFLSSLASFAIPIHLSGLFS